jgi:hypothetical protein
MVTFWRLFRLQSALLTLDHVFDMAADGSDGSNLFLGTEPLLNHDLLTVDHANVHSQVAEIAGERTSWATNRHNASIDFSADAFRQFNNLVAVDSSHDLKVSE